MFGYLRPLVRPRAPLLRLLVGLLGLRRVRLLSFRERCVSRFRRRIQVPSMPPPMADACAPAVPEPLSDLCGPRRRPSRASVASISGKRSELQPHPCCSHAAARVSVVEVSSAAMSKCFSRGFIINCSMASSAGVGCCSDLRRRRHILLTLAIASAAVSHQDGASASLANIRSSRITFFMRPRRTGRDRDIFK